jgi:hypothetical protein
MSTYAGNANFSYMSGSKKANSGPVPGQTPYGYNPTNRLDEPNYSWGSRINDLKGVIGDLRKQGNMGPTEAYKRLVGGLDAGTFNVKPTFSTDPAVRQRSDQIKAESIAGGQQAASEYARQYGAGGGGMGMLATLRGASLGSQGAAEYGLNEAKWRTGVDEGNANRALQALGQLSSDEQSTRGLNASATGAAGGFIQSLLDTSLRRLPVEDEADRYWPGQRGNLNLTSFGIK